MMSLHFDIQVFIVDEVSLEDTVIIPEVLFILIHRTKVFELNY